MEYLLLFALLVSIFSIFAIKSFLRTSTKHNNNQLPSPPSLPILGHLHLVNEPLHRCFFDLKQKYGPIFSLRLGSRLAVVVSSPSLVAEALTKNNVILANHPHYWARKYIGYNYTSLGISPYGEHWRNLRRICKHELLSLNRFKLSSGIWRDETRSFLRTLYDASSNNDYVKVELKPMLTNMFFSIMMRMITGKQTEGDNTRRLQEARFREAIEELFRYGFAGYIGDHLPALQWVDFKGYKKNVVRLTKETDQFLQGLIDDHRRRRGDDGFVNGNSMIDSLLSSQETHPEYYTDEIIKGIFQVRGGMVKKIAIGIELGTKNAGSKVYSLNN